MNKILQLLPFVFLPYPSGLRQPIHHSQLALVCYKIFSDIFRHNSVYSTTNILSLGGDHVVSYYEMIKLIQSSSAHDNAFRCRIFYVPYRLFLLFLFPIIIFSPKLFAALSRINSDLCGFTKSSSVLNSQPFEFTC